MKSTPKSVDRLLEPDEGWHPLDPAPRLGPKPPEIGKGVPKSESVGTYSPAVAYRAASSSYGNTFSYKNGPHIVQLSDPRAPSSVTYSGRPAPGTADTVFSNAGNAFSYKGCVFQFEEGGSGPWVDLVWVTGDPTRDTELSSRTKGQAFAVAETMAWEVCAVFRKVLPSASSWVRVESGGIPQTLDFGAPVFTVQGRRPLAPVVGANQFLTEQGDNFDAVLRVYDTDGNLVATHAKETLIVSGVELWDYFDAPTLGSGGAVFTVQYHAEDAVKEWPNSPTLRLASVRAINPVPLSGTAIRDVDSETTYTYTTPWNQFGMAFTGGTNSNWSYTLEIDYGGASLTLENSMAYTRTFGGSKSWAYTPGVTGPLVDTVDVTDNATVTQTRHSLLAAYTDAAFGVSVMLVKTVTYTGTDARSMYAQNTVPSLSPENQPNPNPSYTQGYFQQYMWVLRGYQPAGTGGPYINYFHDLAGSIDTYVASMELTHHWAEQRKVLIFKNGAQVFEDTYVEREFSSSSSASALSPIGFSSAQTAYMVEPFLIGYGETGSLFPDDAFMPGMTFSMDSLGNDAAIATCDKNGIYVEVVWGGSTDKLAPTAPAETRQRRFYTDTGGDWVAETSMPLGVISDLDRLFRV